MVATCVLGEGFRSLVGAAQAACWVPWVAGEAIRAFCWCWACSLHLPRLFQIVRRNQLPQSVTWRNRGGTIAAAAAVCVCAEMEQYRANYSAPDPPHPGVAEWRAAKKAKA